MNYDERIVSELNELLNANGRTERAVINDGQIYFDGYTVVDNWTPWSYDNGRPDAWVCTDHNNPGETACFDHPEMGGEKWSGSINVWANFVIMTLCHKEGVEWTCDYRTEGAWDIPKMTA